MKFAFGPLPSTRSATLRPIVTVEFPALAGVKMVGLVDSGALGVRMTDQMADLLGVDLDEAPTSPVVAGGGSYNARVADVDLRVGKAAPWRARVSFVSGWQHEYVLLGLEGFFNNFIVTVDAPRSEVRLKASTTPGPRPRRQ